MFDQAWDTGKSKSKLKTYKTKIHTDPRLGKGWFNSLVHVEAMMLAHLIPLFCETVECKLMNLGGIFLWKYFSQSYVCSDSHAPLNSIVYEQIRWK